MKIKAKKTNSASENAITSVLFTYHATSFMEWSHLHGKWVKLWSWKSFKWIEEKQLTITNHNMAQVAEELFMTLMIEQVDGKFYVFFVVVIFTSSFLPS